MAHLERIVHTLVYGGVRRTGLSATLTLRIMRYDGYVYDWDDGTFKALGSATTPAENPDGEIDATNDPGSYYWDLGAGSVVDGILPDAFELDGMYRFEIDESTLTYAVGYSREIVNRREAERYAEEIVANDRVLAEGSVDNYTVYERDGSTAMLTKSVKDKDGGAVKLSPGIPARESTS